MVLVGDTVDRAGGVEERDTAILFFAGSIKWFVIGKRVDISAGWIVDQIDHCLHDDMVVV